jgi:hypothetical protein
MQSLDERVSVLESQMNDTRSDIRAIMEELKDLANQLVGRPSWMVTIIITILSSACVGLMVALATRGRISGGG